MYSKGKARIKLIANILLIFILFAVAYFGIGDNKLLGVQNIKQGLDLRGGVSILYEADTKTGEAPSDKEMSSAISLLRGRLDNKGYTEAHVGIVGTERIVVEIPGIDNVEDAIEMIGKTARLEFRDEEGNVLLTGADVKDSSAGMRQGALANEVSISLSFNRDGTEKFAEATANNVGKPLGIYLDDELLSAPNVNEAIHTGESMISGSFTMEEAQEVSTLIKAGSLPFSLKEISVAKIDAKLGEKSLETSMQAGMLGLLLVMIFMILRYRLFGFASVLALVIYTGLDLIALSAFGVTLTLPGMAGIILSIGMAVDANIIIFERIKEEVKLGKTLRSAIISGYSRATPAIIDGNVTTLIAGIILFMLGTGTIKGFAQTLSIGILLSMFTALVVTRALLISFVSLGIKDKKYIMKASGEEKQFKLNIIEKGKRNILLSGVVLALGLAGMIFFISTGEEAFNYDIEFTGGTLLTIDLHEDVNNKEVAEIVNSSLSVDNSEVQKIDDTTKVVIKTRSMTQDERLSLVDSLGESYSATIEDVESFSDFSPTVSGEMRTNAIIAILVASVAMLFYVSFRFENINTGVSAIIALLHDAFIVILTYSVLRIPLNTAFIAVVLTVLGYSINSTIVIFDRIRENKSKNEKLTKKELVDLSVNQTITRSIFTSITTLFPIITLYLLGVDTLKEFTLPIIIGVLVGTYSSIFISGFVSYKLNEMRNKK